VGQKRLQLRVRRNGPEHENLAQRRRAHPKNTGRAAFHERQARASSAFSLEPVPVLDAVGTVRGRPVPAPVLGPSHPNSGCEHSSGSAVGVVSGNAGPVIQKHWNLLNLVVGREQEISHSWYLVRISPETRGQLELVSQPYPTRPGKSMCKGRSIFDVMDHSSIALEAFQVLRCVRRGSDREQSVAGARCLQRGPLSNSADRNNPCRDSYPTTSIGG